MVQTARSQHSRHYPHRWQALTLGLTLVATPAAAQITPDDTLGTEQSQVNQNVTIRGRSGDRITGGARRGANLFHSFQAFNVNEGQRVYFTNPAGVRTILSRVTGTDVSDILGTLGVEGSANLFLLNPNGIIFGRNARLDITGSFLASTGEQFSFAAGERFSATTPQIPTPLTVSAPIGVQYGNTPGSIIATGTASPISSLAPNLKVENGQTLALLGGDLQLDHVVLSAPGGRIALAAAKSGAIELNATDSLSFRFPVQTQRGDIRLNDSQLKVLADQNGDIDIYARSLALNQSRLFAGIASDQGKPENVSGDITLDATDTVLLSNRSLVSTSVSPENDLFPNIPGIEISAATGNGGNLYVRAAALKVTGGSQLVASSFGTGNAGNVILNIRDLALFTGVVATPNGATSSSAFSRVNQNAQGNGGNVRIAAGSLHLLDGAQISTSTQGQGNAGNVIIHAREQVLLRGRNRSLNHVNTAIFSQVSAGANGNGGDINISAPLLQVSNGAQLRAETAATGNAGSITISVRDRVQLSGSNREGLATAAFSSVERGGNGSAGNIQITTDDLTIREGASLFSRSLGANNPAGNVIIQANRLHLSRGQINAETNSQTGGNINLNISDSINLDNDSRIIASTRLGQGGNITVNQDRAPVDLTMLNRSLITAEATETGSAGNLALNTRRLILTDSAATVSSQQGSAGNLNLTAGEVFLNSSDLTAETAASPTGQSGANINLQDINFLILQNNSLISAEAKNAATGGNVTLDAAAGFLVAAPNQNSDIVASADRGQGGRVTITTEGLFGLEEGRAEPRNLTNDIDVSSNLGLQGTVTINRPDTDPRPGRVELPATLPDISVVQACPNRARPNAAGEFFVTGRGGLPLSPTDRLSGSQLLADWVTVETEPEALPQRSLPAPTTAPAPLVEAQGWIIGAQGEVIFVAQAPSVRASPAPALPHCPIAR